MLSDSAVLRLKPRHTIGIRFGKLLLMFTSDVFPYHELLSCQNFAVHYTVMNMASTMKTVLLEIRVPSSTHAIDMFNNLVGQRRTGISLV